MVTIIKSGTSKNKIKSLLARQEKKKKPKMINLQKYCGILNLKEDPLTVQKKWRDEWE